MSVSKNNPKNNKYEQQILDTSSIGVLITRMGDGTILYANKAIIDLLGISGADSMIGMPVPNFYWDAEDRKAILTRFRAEGSITSNEVRARRADGSMIWVTISIQPFEFNGEQVLLSEIADINARKQAEESLHQTQSLYQSLVEVLPMSICRKDLAGRFTFANQLFLESSQIKLADLVGKTDFDLHPSELADKYRSDDLAVMESGKVKQFIEERMVHEGDETVYVETIKTPIYDGAGKVNGIQISFWDITDRMRAEEDLLLRDRALASSVNAVIIIRLSDNKNIYLNDALLKMTGYTREEAMRLKFSDIAGDPGEMKKIQSAIDAQGFFSSEELIKRKDGSLLPVNFSTSFIKDAKGRPFAIQSSFFDITERKQAEQAQKESEERFRSLYNNATIGLYRTTPDGKILMVNPTGLRLLGFDSFEEMAKRNLEQSGFEEADARKNFRKKLEREGIIEQESVWTKKDGTPIFVRESSTISRDENGNILYYDGSFEDITANKQAEEALRTSEERFKRFTEATVEGLVFHEQGKIIDANPAVLIMFGLSDSKEFIGSNLLDFIVPESHKLVMQQMQLESVSAYEIQGIRKDGTMFPMETATRAYHDGQRIIRASSIRDITARKQAETELRQSEIRLSNAIRIARMGYWDLDIDTQMFILNDQYYRTFHATTTEEMGGNQMSVMDFIQRFVPPGEGNIIGNGIQEAIETKDPNFHTELEAKNLTVQGEVRWVSVWLTAEKDEHGRTIKLHGVNQDITERKQAEEELSNIFDFLPDATFVTDRERRVISWNRAIEEMTGVKKEDIVGKGDFAYAVPFYGEARPMLIDSALDQSQISDRYESVQKQSDRLSAEIYVPSVYNGRGAHLFVTTSPLLDANGAVVGAIESIRDITERKQAERKLQENQQLLQLVMDNIPQSVFWKDKANLNYLGVNQAFAEDAGFNSPQDLVGKDDFNMPWKEQADLYRADDQRVLELGEPKLNYEEPQTGPTGQVTWLRTSKIPMRDASGQVFAVLGMYEDVTERKQLESQVQEAFERRGYQVQISTEISQEVAAASQLNDLFDRVVTLTKERLGYYHTQLLRYDTNQDAVVLINGYGKVGQKMLAGGHQMPMGEGLIGTAAASGKTVLRPTLADDPDWHSNPLLPDTQGEIAVPIKWQDTVLGVLDVQSDKAGALTEDDRLLLEGICGQVAIAMHSAELVEAIRQNETKLAEALRAARLANFEYDVEKDIFTFNDEFYSIFHTTAEKVGGYQISSARYAEIFVHPDDMEVVGIEIGKALSSTERVYNTTLDHRILYEDGGIGYITVKVTVERDENGKITRYYGANQDITERKQAEEALRVNEAHLSEALRAARLANWEYDVEKDLFTFNDEFYSIFHTTAEKAGGYQISSARYAEIFVHPDDLEIVGIEIGKALSSTGRVYNTTLDHRIRYEDGSIGYIMVKITVERDENGKITRYYGANQDITERKQAEEALRVNETFLTEALQIARLAHWEYDVEKDIFTFNDQFYSIFHTTAEEQGGYQLSSAYYAQHFVYPEDLPVVGVEIEQALNSTGRHYSRDVEHRILYADGSIGYMQVNISVDRDENGKIIRYYGANQDITERIKAQHELAERLEEINRLYQNLSHEGWKEYRDTADLPTGFMYDQAELKPIDEGVLADELFSNTPMRVLGGEVVGTLSIANDPLHPTSPEDQAFFEQVSDQIALALEGARLTAQTQSALAQSESLYQLSSTLNTAATYDDILRVLRENTILGKNQLHIGISVFDRTWTPEEEPLWIDTLAHWSRFPTESGIENDHFTIASFPAARTILHPDTPTLIEDFETDERIDENTRLLYTKRFGAKSAIFFPLVVTGQWIGYINALYQQQVAFPENEIRQLGALIAQASTMVNNLRQVGRIQQQAERETTLNIISQKIQNATTVEAVLQIAARELGHALGAPMTIAQLSMKDKN